MGWEIKWKEGMWFELTHAMMNVHCTRTNALYSLPVLCHVLSEGWSPSLSLLPSNEILPMSYQNDKSVTLLNRKHLLEQ